MPAAALAAAGSFVMAGRFHGTNRASISVDTIIVKMSTLVQGFDFSIAARSLRGFSGNDLSSYFNMVY
jgi:hypothetical protein